MVHQDGPQPSNRYFPTPTNRSLMCFAAHCSLTPSDANSKLLEESLLAMLALGSSLLGLPLALRPARPSGIGLLVHFIRGLHFELILRLNILILGLKKPEVVEKTIGWKVLYSVERRLHPPPCTADDEMMIGSAEKRRV